MTSTPDAIQAFVDATNRGDSDAFVAAFTTDTHLDDWGRSFDGHDGVRSWDGTDNIGVQSHFDLLDVTPGTGDEEYVANIRVSGNGYNGTGPMVFRIRDGLIADLRIGPNAS
jgi:hypothetical protein